MKPLHELRAQAVVLRKQGLTYQEILKQLPVAKSSLSLWLKDSPLTEAEKHLLKRRVDVNITKGRIRAATSNRQNKINKDKLLLQIAKETFENHKHSTLFQIGVALYWAEGAKRNSMFHFMNSDAAMVAVVIRWLEAFTEYKKADLGFRLYIHHPFIKDNWEEWWQKQLRVTGNQFKKTVIKPTGLGVKKRPNYKGCIRLEVPRSVHLLTKMKFWINMLVEYQAKQ